MYRAPAERISFGDIFEAHHLIDVHASSETRPLGGKPLPRPAAVKLAGANNLTLKDAGDKIPVFTPAVDQHPDRFDALARGGNVKQEGKKRAILLTDSCAVDTALVVGRAGRRTRGRLLFAPITPPGDDDNMASLRSRPQFGRFPLPDHDAGPGIVELRHCFMVDVRDVHAGDRVLALDDETAEELEIAWSAYALRRGPLATEHNVTKLASIVTSEPSELDPVEMIEETLNAAWRIEGRYLREAAESPQLDTEKMNRLVSELKQLEEAARIAHERLSRSQD